MEVLQLWLRTTQHNPQSICKTPEKKYLLMTNAVVKYTELNINRILPIRTVPNNLIEIEGINSDIDGRYKKQQLSELSLEELLLISKKIGYPTKVSKKNMEIL